MKIARPGGPGVVILVGFLAMLTTVKPPAKAAQWLMEQFEENVADYRSGEVGSWCLGLEIQDMIRLKDDLETHGYPRCYLCGWTGEGKEPPVPVFPLYSALPGGFLRAVRITQSRPYLQAGLPPV